jgi:uncharacterized membrane protein (UPF0127 family)
LLGRDSLDASAALVLSPCAAIHTAFMRFPIDVLFLDRHGGVLRIVHDLGAWRLAAAARARAVIELSGGSLRGCDVQIGDRLYLAPHGGADAENSTDSSLNFAVKPS